MALNPDAKGGSTNKLPEVGLQPARCFAIIELGLQPSSFKGVVGEPKQEVMVCFELTKYMNKYEDKEYPTTINQKYGWSAGTKAKLPDVLKSWGSLKTRPEKIVIKPYLGQYCFLNISHSEDGKYANIASAGRGINPFMKGMERPSKFHADIYFEIPVKLKDFDWNLFFKLPPYAQKLIRGCGEWQAIIQASPEPTKTMEQAQQSQMMEEEGEVFTNDDAPAF